MICQKRKNHTANFTLETAESEWFDPVTGEPLESGLFADIYRTFSLVEQNHEAQSVITAPGVKPFREFVLFAHNGIRMLDKAGNLIKTTEEGEPHGAHGEVDYEDTGEKGYNYRSERFANRLRQWPVVHRVFDSKIHGEPATPVFTAYTRERVIIRYLMPGDKPRNISFLIHGHVWQEQPDNPLSNVEAAKGAISVGNVYNLELLGGAADCPGDYL